MSAQDQSKANQPNLNFTAKADVGTNANLSKNISSDKPVAVHALIVAAGTGSRFGGDKPKQYQKIGDKTVLEHSITRLIVPQIADLTLVIAQADAHFAQLDLSKTLPPNLPITLTNGGDERWQSVANGVAAIRAAGAADDDWVLIHDAARPCLPMVDLQNLLAVQDEPFGAILATPVVDTLKLSQQGAIVRTVDRQNLWCALTPQMFRLAALERVLAQVARDNLAITDEASAFEAAGLPIKIVAGSRMNIKLTHADDLAMMSAILTHAFGE